MVFNYVRRGLVEKDKLIVASLIALRILRLGDGGGWSATEAFISPQPSGDSVMYPEEAQRWDDNPAREAHKYLVIGFGCWHPASNVVQGIGNTAL